LWKFQPVIAVVVFLALEIEADLPGYTLKLVQGDMITMLHQSSICPQQRRGNIGTVLLLEWDIMSG